MKIFSLLFSLFLVVSAMAENRIAVTHVPGSVGGTALCGDGKLLYLAGEDAGYITGQVFGVNGGLVI